MGKRPAYGILVGKRGGKRPLGIPRRNYKIIIMINPWP
jgi:hypothetical protein